MLGRCLAPFLVKLVSSATLSCLHPCSRRCCSPKKQLLRSPRHISGSELDPVSQKAALGLWCSHSWCPNAFVLAAHIPSIGLGHRSVLEPGKLLSLRLHGLCFARGGGVGGGMSNPYMLVSVPVYDFCVPSMAHSPLAGTLQAKRKMDSLGGDVGCCPHPVWERERGKDLLYVRHCVCLLHSWLCVYETLLSSHFGRLTPANRPLASARFLWHDPLNK